jgi:hypothetical protein
MTDDQILEGLAPIEERYSKKYSPHEVNLLGEEFRWMTSEKWSRFCGIVLAAGEKFIPSVKRFKELYELHRLEFPKTRKLHRGDCKECKGYGVRSWVRRSPKGKFDVASARCSCPNGEHNYGAFPPFWEVETWPQFVSWVDTTTPNIVAVAMAEREARA